MSSTTVSLSPHDEMVLRYRWARSVWAQSEMVRDAAQRFGHTERSYCDELALPITRLTVESGSTASAAIAAVDLDRAWEESATRDERTR